MIIIVNNWKKKLLNLAKVVVIVLAFAILLPRLAGILGNYMPVFSGWSKDESPSGNPMRVENTEGTEFDRMVDQFVIKLQNFYYEEKE
ncbi:MAG: hypothetical protein ACOX2B_02540 [Syntrophothermaceae bacterium]|jgi:hypothetical protein